MFLLKHFRFLKPAPESTLEKVDPSFTLCSLSGCYVYIKYTVITHYNLFNVCLPYL